MPPPSAAEDNSNKVDQGTLAPVELKRAQAQVAAARQDLVNSDGFVRQQELILKSVLVRDIPSDAEVNDARIVPTDPLNVAARPNSPRSAGADGAGVSPRLSGCARQDRYLRIQVTGTRNELRPELDLVANMLNAGLAGSANSLYSVSPGSIAPGPGTVLGYGMDTAQRSLRFFSGIIRRIRSG